MRTKNMKTTRRILSLLLLAVIATACNKDMPALPSGSDTPPSGNELLSIRFEQPDKQPRAITETTSLTSGIRFKVYAYNQGTVITRNTTPLAEASYQVATDNSGKIESIENTALKLFAGIYDFYFVSYNSAIDTPTAGTGTSSSLVSGIANGRDFLYTAMRDVAIRSTGAGEGTFTVTLSEPFKRLSSAMKVSVKAADTHPVTPTSLKVESIAVSGLSDNRSFVLGQDALETGGQYAQGHTFPASAFTVAGDGNETNLTNPRASSDYLILPTDGSAGLHFTVTLKVSYNGESGTPITDEEFVYEIPLTKSLLAGVRYEFAFTLTFFDHYLPGNLELDVVPFVEVPPLDTGVVGD